MRDVHTELECINLRIEILNEESKQLYRLLENFHEVNEQTIDSVRETVLERLEQRKSEMRKELHDLFERVKQLGMPDKTDSADKRK